MTWVLYLIIACGALSIAYGVWTTRAVLAADPGTARMQEIAAAIQEGAQAYLARQYTTIGRGRRRDLPHPCLSARHPAGDRLRHRRAALRRSPAISA